MKKIGTKKALTMTSKEINRAIFKGAGPYTPRGPRDAFTDAAVCELASREDLEDTLKRWLWSSVDAILTESGV